jgi:hypothetical protein
LIWRPVGGYRINCVSPVDPSNATGGLKLDEFFYNPQFDVVFLAIVNETD